MKSSLSLLISAAAAACALSPVRAATPLELTPGTTIEIPHSKGKFDFLRIDTKRHRLLAAHENDGTADYVDLQKGTLITRLELGGAVDTAIDADSTFYYVSVQESERVAVVDAAKLREVKSIKIPGPTDAIIFEPKNRMIYVTHDNGAEVWVIDPKTDTVSATITVPGVPEFMVYDDHADKIYLNIKDKNVVAVIDPAANTVVGQWPTDGALHPHGMALDAGRHRVYVAGDNGKLVAIDTASGKVVDTLGIVPKVDQIALDADAGLLYCAGTDKMSVVRTGGAKLAEIGQLATAGTARNVAVDPATHHVWSTYTDGKSSFAKSWMPPQG